MEALSLRGGPTILKLLWNLGPLRDVTATLPFFGNKKIIFPAFDGYWCRHLWAKVPYEQEVEQIFRKIGKGRVLIDCGANIGYWSVRAPEFGFTQVIAVEANERLLPLLRENFRINGIIGAVHHAAIHSRFGEALLLELGASHAQGHIGATGAPVKSITIADLAAQFPTGTEIVAKVDVEGSEIPAFQGAAGCDSIIFVYEDFQSMGMKVTEYLLTHGFRVFAVLPAGDCAAINSLAEAIDISAAVSGNKKASNLVACAPSLAPRLEAELFAR